jgi:2-hydroxy-3-keto-5-methylthiopentenyl-1-phosphate phosphatase
MIILCDFDGSVTERSVSELIEDRSHPSNEQQRPAVARTGGGEERPVSGQWQLVDLAQHITADDSALDPTLPALPDPLRVRDGFGDFLSLVRRRQDCVHLLTNDLEHVLRSILPPGVEFSAAADEFDAGWSHGVRSASDWRMRRVSELLRGHVGQRSVYIGNGRADFTAARLCQRIYAVKGSSLAEACHVARRPVTEFETFDEIAHALYGVGLSECRVSA